MSIEETIIALERRWMTAEIERDVEVARALLHDNCRIVDGTGGVHGRQAVLDGLASPAISVAAIEPEELDVTSHGPGVAIVVGLVTASGTMHGDPFLWRLRYMRTYVREGEWRLLASMWLPMPGGAE